MEPVDPSAEKSRRFLNMKHPHLILHGNNFDSNRGCQALRLTTQMILDRYLPDYPRWYANIFYNDDPQFLSEEPDKHSAGQVWETRRQGTPTFYLWGARVVVSRLLGRFPATRVRRVLDQAAALLALGGDNLSYDYGFLATLLFFSPLEAAARKGIPTVVWGASIGPFSKRPAWEKRFAELLRRVDLITVREPITRDYLDGLGVRENVRRAADPAFLLPACPAELPEEIERALQAGAVGINLAPLMKRYNNLSSRAWKHLALEMLAEMRRITDHPLVLIPHVMMSPRIFPDNDDYQFLQTLKDLLPPGKNRGIFLYDARRHSSRQIKWVISRLKVFVGSRLHSVIAALSSCVPTFCIGHSIKSRGILRDVFGHERWMVHVSQLTAGQVGEHLQALLQEETVVREYLHSLIPDYSQTAWKGGEFLQQVLRERGRALR
jgi:colanic acid/amylovoran biosynthesis protein